MYCRCSLNTVARKCSAPVFASRCFNRPYSHICCWDSNVSACAQNIRHIKIRIMRHVLVSLKLMAPWFVSGIQYMVIRFSDALPYRFVGHFLSVNHASNHFMIHGWHFASCMMYVASLKGVNIAVTSHIRHGSQITDNSRMCSRPCLD